MDGNKNSVKVLYKNWEGITAIRNIIPLKIWYGKTQWHKTSQWLIKVYDIDKKAERDYAMKDIIEWDTKSN